METSRLPALVISWLVTLSSVYVWAAGIDFPYEVAGLHWSKHLGKASNDCVKSPVNKKAGQ